MTNKKNKSKKPVNASKEQTKEDEDEESMLNFVKVQVNKLFIDHIPVDSIKELNGRFLYIIGTAAHIAGITIFVYFLYYSYQDSIKKAFISIDESSGRCNSVSIAVSGTYYADSHGNWIGTPHYLESDAIYALTFSNYEISSNSQYAAMMENFYASLQVYGGLALSSNLAHNLVLWAMMARFYSNEDPSSTNYTQSGFGQLQTFTLTGDSTVIFELEHNLGNVASAYGVCQVTTDTSYDQANGRQIFEIGNVTHFRSSEACSMAMDLDTFGYISAIDHNSFSISLDVRTLLSGMAVNYGLVSINSMQSMTRQPQVFVYRGVAYTAGQYYDAEYTLMQTVFCVRNSTAIPRNVRLPSSLCMIFHGTTFALPIFNHYGASNLRPSYCYCKGSTASDEDCQIFNFLSGLLYYNNPSNSTSTEPPFINLNNLAGNVTQLFAQFGLFYLMDLAGSYESYDQLNMDAYNASFVTTSPLYGCGTSCLNQVFEFCRMNNTPTGGCSLLMINSESSRTQTVSEFKYQLTNGSCSNSFVVSPSTWQNLVENPPVKFTQDYYECYQTDFSAMLNSLGVASGNTALFMPFFVVIALPLVYVVLWLINQVPPREEYDNNEKAQVMDILAMVLLRLRDGKTRSIKRDGVLLRMTKELIAAAKEEGGYPDSDDEDDEEEETAQQKRRKSAKSPLHKQIGNGDDEDDADDGNDADDDNDRQREALGSTRRGRKRMDVFTRHLQVAESTRYKSRRSSANGNGGDLEMSRIMSYFRSDGQAKRGSQTVPRESSIVGAMGIDRYPDLTSTSPPKHVMILNQEAAQGNANKPLMKPHDAEILLDDLLKLLGEALAFVPDDPKQQQTACTAVQVEVDSDDEEQGQRAGEGRLRRKDLPCFAHARTLAGRLGCVDLVYHLNTQDFMFFMKLSNVLCMHASIELEMEMREVASAHASRIAYNVGQRLMTAANLQSVL